MWCQILQRSCLRIDTKSRKMSMMLSCHIERRLHTRRFFNSILSWSDKASIKSWSVCSCRPRTQPRYHYLVRQERSFDKTEVSPSRRGACVTWRQQRRTKSRQLGSGFQRTRKRTFLWLSSLWVDWSKHWAAPRPYEATLSYAWAVSYLCSQRQQRIHL